MRKNLFLTFALLLASFATVNAQWSQTMSALDGFAGVADEQTGCKTIKTGLITPDSPIEGLRITIVDTEAPELNKGVTMAAFAPCPPKRSRRIASSLSANCGSPPLMLTSSIMRSSMA